jgi:hypothetical protein
MRKVSGLLVLGILITIVGVLPAGAQQCQNGTTNPCAQMQYHGGPILENFTIYPLYFGDWTQQDMNIQQSFLNNLAAYISGENAPEGRQPTLWQYGPRKATVAAPVMANTTTSPGNYLSSCFSSGNLTQQQLQEDYGNQTQFYPSTSNPAVSSTLYLCDIQQIIAENQGSAGPASNEVPPFGPQTLIMVFPANNFLLDPYCQCLGYHSSSSDSAFWGAVSPTYFSMGPYQNSDSPQLSQFQGATSHEIFEAAADPADNNFNAWVSVACQQYTTGATDCTSPAGITYFSSQDEPADQCNTVVALSWPGFFEDPEGIEVFGDGTLYFASIVDNTRNGACTTTGYMSMDEFPLYAQTSAQIQHQNEVELENDYQLYILQSYVLDRQVYYNAVWRPQTGGSAAAPYDTGQEEDFSYAAPYLGQFNSVYDSGWGLYTLQSYVGPGGPSGGSGLFYNGVWRQGTSVTDTVEHGLFGATEDAFRAEYELEFPSPNDWRLYLLQTHVVNGELLFDAVWRQPDGANTNSPPTPCTCTAEQHVYGWTRADYLKEYAKLSAIGYRLYIVDSYVIDDGTVRYNAIWRLANHDEFSIYGYTLADYKTEYQTETANGYRLYILNVYVLPGDEVRYDAVWRRGVVDRPL